MSESTAWSTLRDKLKRPGLHIQRFEDLLTAGIPDTNLCYKGAEIWLEGKFLEQYPKRETTPIKIGLRDEQEQWIRRRITCGGSALIWCRVPDGWMLFDGSSSAQLYNGLPYDELKAIGDFYATAKELADSILFLLEQRSQP